MKPAVPKPLTADDLAKVYTEDEVVGFKQFEEEGGQFGKAVVRSYNVKDELGLPQILDGFYSEWAPTPIAVSFLYSYLSETTVQDIS